MKNESATPCPSIKGKTADDCPKCGYLKENPLLPGSGYCHYPEKQRGDRETIEEPI
jgi:hypothetical protein